MKIRIIPMSINDKEFAGKTIKEIQNNFFMGSLINVEKGWYYYATSGLNIENENENVILLFQMTNTIIAAGMLDSIIKFIEPTKDGNHGAYVLDCKTIKVFKPIEKDELADIIINFESFGRTKQSIDITDNEYIKLKERMRIYG